MKMKGGKFMTDEKVRVQKNPEVIDWEDEDLNSNDAVSNKENANDTDSGDENFDGISGNVNKAYADLMDKYQRNLAEFDNFRKRTLREKSQAYDNGIQDAVEKLLPALDNFERALSTKGDMDGSHHQETFYQGIVMIARQLDTYLTDLGIEAITGSGSAFDHNLHYAVAHVEDPSYGAGEIIEELQKGYTYKGKVIRPSMVKVAN